MAYAVDKLQAGLEESFLSRVSEIKIKTAIAKTEVDTVPDVFGALYRVWDGMQLLGTFYEKIDGSWVAQPCNSDYRPTVKTSDQAHLVIVASWLQQ